MNERANVEQVSDRLVKAGLNYLSHAGLNEDPSLVYYREVVEHMLRTTVSKGSAQVEVTDEMCTRASDYFDKYYDLDNPEIVCQPKFVSGLFHYAFNAEDVYGDDAPSSVLGVVKH